MPISRYQIRNEYTLADPELYRAADRDDPEAILEGVAMAGLVGVLRQLGDLAEFAAEIFHNLHEEIMATSARGHGLMLRVQQLEEEFPSIEKAFLSQTNHSHFTYSGGIDWHANLPMDQNLITRGDLPRFVMDSYEECRGPPRLFLLDKFDIAGAGACLKRYSDPSFFKTEFASLAWVKVDTPRDEKARKVKRKGPQRKVGDTLEFLSASDFSYKLNHTSADEPADISKAAPTYSVKLKKKRLNGSSNTRNKSYMEQFIKINFPEKNSVSRSTLFGTRLKRKSSSSSDSCPEIHEIVVEKANNQMQKEQNEVLKQVLDDSDSKMVKRGALVSFIEPAVECETQKKASDLGEVESRDIGFDAYRSDDNTSETENYADALTTVESEMEGDLDRIKQEVSFFKIPNHGMDSDVNDEQLEQHGNLSDSHSCENSSLSRDSNSSLQKGRSNSSYSDTLSNAGGTFESSKVCPAEFHDLSLEAISRPKEISANKSPESLVLDGAVDDMSGFGRHVSKAVEPSFDSCVTDKNADSRLLCPGSTDQIKISSSEWVNKMTKPSTVDSLQLPDVLVRPSEAEGLRPSGIDNEDLHEKMDDKLIGETFKGRPSGQGCKIKNDSSLDINSTGCHEEDSGSKVLNGGLLQADNLVDKKTDEVIYGSVNLYADTPARSTLSYVDAPEPVNEPTNVIPDGTVTNVCIVMSHENVQYPPSDIVAISLASEKEVTEIATPQDNDSNSSSMPQNSSCPVDPQYQLKTVNVLEESDVQISGRQSREATIDENEPENLATLQESLTNVHEQRTGLVPETSLAEVVGGGHQPYPTAATETSCDRQFNVFADEDHPLELDADDSRSEVNGSFDEVCEQLTDLVAGVKAFETGIDNNRSNLGISPVASSPEPSDVLVAGDISAESGADVGPSDSIASALESTVQLLEKPTEVVLGDTVVQSEINDKPHSIVSSETYVAEVPEQSIISVTRDVETDASDLGFDIVGAQEKYHDHLEETEGRHTAPDQSEKEAPEASDPENIRTDSQIIPLIEVDPMILGPLDLKPDAVHPGPGSDSESEFLDCVINPVQIEEVQIEFQHSNEPEASLCVEETNPSCMVDPLLSEEINHLAETDSSLCNYQFDGAEDSSLETDILQTSAEVKLRSSYEETRNPCSLEGIDYTVSLSPRQSTNENVDFGCSTSPLPEPTFAADQASDQEPQASKEHPLELLQQAEVPEAPDCCNQMLISESFIQISPESLHDSLSPAKDIVHEPELLFEQALKREEYDFSSEIQLDKVQSSEVRGSDLPIDAEAGPSTETDCTLSVSLPEALIQLPQCHNHESSERGISPSDLVLPTEMLTGMTQQLPTTMAEMPPLPPLPPLQWRMSKLRQGSFTLGEVVGPPPSILVPFIVREEQSTHEYFTHPGETSQHTNPFLSTAKDTDLVPPSNPFVYASVAHEMSQNKMSDLEEQTFHPSNPFAPLPAEKPQNGSIALGDKIDSPPSSSAVEDEIKPLQDSVTVGGNPAESPHEFELLSSSDDIKPNGKSQHPRRKDPLIEAVAAHDRSKLRKVSERVIPDIKPKTGERDSLLEQIRTKSFNLKRAVATRPIVHGPKTNLNVVAILEKAHAIRQAFAGSDEDDDADSWSDS